jgi:hypothetical protein
MFEVVLQGMRRLFLFFQNLGKAGRLRMEAGYFRVKSI